MQYCEDVTATMAGNNDNSHLIYMYLALQGEYQVLGG